MIKKEKKIFRKIFIVTEYNIEHKQKPKKIF